MKKMSVYTLVLLLLVFSNCSSSKEMDVDEEQQEEMKENPIANTDPTEGFSLGSLRISNNIGHPPLGIDWGFVDSHSDDFNYSGKDNGEFVSKWNDTYFNAWLGPGLTEWTSNNSDVVDGNLVIQSSRKAETEKVYCGVITAKEKIIYPIYSEVRAKVANQVLSSNFWFLSSDDKREIDVLEVYGGDREGQEWFAARASTNYHVFVRGDSNEILQDLNDQKHHTVSANEEPWRDDWHRFGVYWKDAFTLDFYYDGELVRQLRKSGIEDPENLGLDREMNMIIDIEDHAWRSFPSNGNPQIRATDAELANGDKNEYLIDYVHTYKPTDAYDGGLISNGSFDDPNLGNWYWKGNIAINTDFNDNQGETYAVRLGNDAALIQKIDVTKNTEYLLKGNFKTNNNSSVSFGIFEGESKNINAAEDWQETSVTFNSGDNSVIYVTINNKGDDTILVDSFSLTQQ
ncbi:beta-agarase [Maribacter sp. 2210JD10-5]|uniref:beta-agarase n=1 Tax=Maribacter sp. 2210JD10-5 TaxID=3386272 RepID=UPI0039BCDC22